MNAASARCAACSAAAPSPRVEGLGCILPVLDDVVAEVVIAICARAACREAQDSEDGQDGQWQRSHVCVGLRNMTHTPLCFSPFPMSRVSVRPAERRDVPVIVALIRELAIFEKEEQQVKVCRFASECGGDGWGWRALFPHIYQN